MYAGWSLLKHATGVMLMAPEKSAARREAERRPAFRPAQRWRAGGEGAISRLKR